MIKQKETYKEKAQWLKLVEWVEINIFNYDVSYQRLQRKSCFILKGLSKGQIVANNNYKSNADYPLDVVLMAFKANKVKIQDSIKNKTFSSEDKKMLYVCSIVRNDLEDIYNRYLKVIQKNKEV